mmetsp:Transcript_39812/g.45392  ORF Transcript_39812/g.45392 Transcript_39812/m.45392 type:complete len:149 (+) Transcript_39812:1470-1916(+)
MYDSEIESLKRQNIALKFDLLQMKESISSEVDRRLKEKGWEREETIRQLRGDVEKVKLEVQHEVELEAASQMKELQDHHDRELKRVRDEGIKANLLLVDEQERLQAQIRNLKQQSRAKDHAFEEAKEEHRHELSSLVLKNERYVSESD